MNDTPDLFVPMEVSNSNFPRKTLTFSVLTLCIVLVLNVFHEQLNEWLQMNPGVPNVVTGLLIVLTGLAWLIWILLGSGWFFSRRLLVASILALPPLIGLLLYQPVFDGDLAFVRFESRFVSPVRDFAEAVPVSERGESVLEVTPQDFPQFLGPNRDATVTNVRLKTDWEVAPPKTVWKTAIGDGWSGFVVVGDCCFTQEQREQFECVTCYDVETGQQLWCYQAERRHEDVSAVGRVGPRATPAVHDGFIYAAGGTGVLDCLDATSGELKWSVDVPSLVGIEQMAKTNSRGLSYTQENSTLTWGRSGSPLIVDDLVIVPAGGPAGGPAVTMFAFDRKTGGERWRGGKRSISYGSPSLLEIDGQQQVVLIAEKSAVGHDLVSGEELWAHAWPGNSNGDASCSQVTGIDSDTLLLSKGYGVGGELIRVSRTEAGWATESLESNSRVLKTKFNNPVIYEEHAYSLSDGFLECTQLPQMKRRWKKRGRFGNGQLLLVGNSLLVHSETGTLYLVRANAEAYEELGSYKTIDGVCWNTLCLSGDRLLVRSELEAAMIRLPLEDDLAEDTIVESAGRSRSVAVK